MKKLSLLIILASFAYGVKAQNAEVVNAFNYQKFKEYDKAKISIDKAILDPKTGISAKTWYYRGLIYFDITTSEDANVKVLDKDALDKSLESFQKSIELDVKKQYLDDCKRKIGALSPFYANKGIEQYQAKDYLEAAKNFEKFYLMKKDYLGKVDTTFAYNSALATFYGKDYNGAIPLLKRSIEIGYNQFDVHYLLAQSYLITKDTVSAISAIAVGKEKFPTNKDLQNLEINVYLAKNQLNVLIDKLKKSIETDPQNKLLYLILGSTYESLANPKNAKGEDLPKPKNNKELIDLSEKAYLSAIKIDSNLFDALYNLGAMHYNSGVEVYNKVKDLPMSKEKEYNAGKAKYTALFNKSLPYLEKALEIQPTDVNTLMSLKEVYAKLDNFGKSGEMKKRIEALRKK